MRRIVPVLSLSFVAVLAACGEGPNSTSPDGTIDAAATASPPRYIVVFQDDVRDIRGVAQEIARGNGFGLQRVREHAARGFTAVIPEARVDAVRSDPRVKFLEKDGPVSLIRPIIEARPGGGGGAQETPWGITRVGGPGGPPSGRAYIIDTGVDLDHPDLNVGTGSDCVAYFTGRSADDGNGHGTHVAGTIGAINNSIGVVGVAPGATICPVRVLGNSGSGTWSDVIDGIDFVAANGNAGDVANMSLGGSPNTAVDQAVSDAAATGVKFCLAAGNDGDDANNHSPARVNGTNIYTVSAINSSNALTSWSNWGNPPVDYAAPGASILSTWKGGGTKTISGTSMAAPHVAGILLLGSVKADGFAQNDPDGNPDPIAHR